MEIHKLAGTDLCLTTAYYLSADGQSERTVQTVQVILRCMLMDKAEVE